MADINLLPVEEKAQERFLLLQKRLSAISVVMLAIVAIFTLGTLFAFTTMASKRNQLLTLASEAATRIEAYKASEELIVVVKNKASNAVQILGSRTDHPRIFERFSALIPQNVYFTDIKLSSQKIVISGKAKTSADVSGLVSSLLSPEGSRLVNNLTVDSLSSDETGVYQFALTAQVVPGGVVDN